MRRVGHGLAVLLLCLSQAGCIGLGVWTVGTRTESSEQALIAQERGAVNLRATNPLDRITTGRELRAQWGEPDEVVRQGTGREAWVYKNGKWRWAGALLYLVIVPLPAMIPVGTQSLVVQIEEGLIRTVTRRDWEFQYGLYCGLFGTGMVMPVCGAGSYEDMQFPTPGPP